MINGRDPPNIKKPYANHKIHMLGIPQIVPVFRLYIFVDGIHPLQRLYVMLQRKAIAFVGHVRAAVACGFGRRVAYCFPAPIFPAPISSAPMSPAFNLMLKMMMMLTIVWIRRVLVLGGL